MTARYPRPLTQSESELIQWILPAESPGYMKYREWIRSCMVIGEGRRGEGNIILGWPDVRPDSTLPTSHVIAYGVIETERESTAVAVRERVEDQVEVDIMPLESGARRTGTRSVRRWTLSTWNPGDVCPQCGAHCREVPVMTASNRSLLLALCRRDRRIWLRHVDARMTLPIPVTNFYNELMLQMKIRDPHIALRPDRLFADLDRYSDRDLLLAFRNYNMVHSKIDPHESIVIPPEAAPRGRYRLTRRVKDILRNFLGR